MKKVAILYICTEKYVIFWKDFFISYEKYFLPDSEKHYYVYTDSDKIYAENECDRIHKIYQKSLGWPDNTLMRFHIFLGQEKELEQFDYLFFMNANCMCVDYVSEREFLPHKKDLLVVQHPGFYNQPNRKYTYDRNRKSTAYIPYGKGKYYICGGVNGGKSKAFIRLMKELKENIDIDKKNNQIAVWHDESHINHYILGREDYKILTPSYCYPEDWNLPFDEKIRIRDKSKWIDVKQVKNVVEKRENTISKILKIMVSVRNFFRG